MTFIEFRRRNGTRFLFDSASQWEIDDKGNNPALWGNPEQFRNMDCAETYEQVRAKLLEPTQPVAEPAPAQAQDACNWSLTYDYSEMWESSCGEEWTFIDGGPAENSVRFCHGCGKPVAIEDQQGGSDAS